MAITNTNLGESRILIDVHVRIPKRKRSLTPLFLSKTSTISRLFKGRWPMTTKLTVGTLSRFTVSWPTILTPRAFWAGSIKNDIRGSRIVCSCAAIASKVALRSFFGVNERRYALTPVVPYTISYPGPPGWSLYATFSTLRKWWTIWVTECCSAEERTYKAEIWGPYTWW